MGKILPVKKQKEKQKMKKVISAIVTAFAVLTLCICLAACSESVEGTYKFSSMTVTHEGSDPVEIKAGDDWMGMSVTSDFYVLTINSDNTWTMKVQLGGAETESGTWEEKDGKFLLDPGYGEKSILKATLSGGTFTIEENGNKIVLKKI